MYLCLFLPCSTMTVSMFPGEDFIHFCFPICRIISPCSWHLHQCVFFLMFGVFCITITRKYEMYAVCWVCLCVLELPLAASALCPLDTCVEEQSQMHPITAGVGKHREVTTWTLPSCQKPVMLHFCDPKVLYTYIKRLDVIFPQRYSVKWYY